MEEAVVGTVLFMTRCGTFEFIEGIWDEPDWYWVYEESGMADTLLLGSDRLDLNTRLTTRSVHG